MTKKMSKEDWMELVQKAKETSSFSFDNTSRTAHAVLDECCDEEEQHSLIQDISDLAPTELNMNSKLQLSYLLLCLLVKQGRFDLKRDLKKETEEAAAAFREMIEALKAIDKLQSEPVPSVSDSLPSVLLEQRSTKLKLKKGKRVRFNVPSTVDHKDKSLEDLINVEIMQSTSAPLKKNCRYHVCGEVLGMKDFLTLKNPKWLNDKVINAYLAVLQREQNLKNIDHVFAMPSYMAVLWGQGKIDHWLYSDVKFAMYKWIFLPANVSGNHWVLLAANVPQAAVSVLDSMGGNNQALIENWKRYMTIRSEKTGELGNKVWKTGDLVSSRQKDGNACGSFVMLNALALSKNMDLKDVSHSLSLNMREFVWCKLLAASEEPPSQRSKCDMVGCTSPKRATWVACNVCGRWSHLPCVGLKDAPRSDYICPICVAQYQ
ncbi:uncharacterized protein LOC132557052 [Ylistrum balloti]|uniref:uncharacterized protein LOC132557052 n=1 Tax=Ylistrum balloti TaxID=509963 RepID=UPI002905ED68|nr:uncharacterized protein LOC132557052 [Ylistrum balloti]